MLIGGQVRGDVEPSRESGKLPGIDIGLAFPYLK
jgi:hypothetical protein